VGLATENLSLQAVAMGLQTFFVAGYDVDAAKAVIDPAETWRPVAMFAIGYAGRVDELDEVYRKKEARERTRQPLDAILFEGEWGRGHRET
jgi:nitroreductase